MDRVRNYRTTRCWNTNWTNTRSFASIPLLLLLVLLMLAVGAVTSYRGSSTSAGSVQILHFSLNWPITTQQRRKKNENLWKIHLATRSTIFSIYFDTVLDLLLSSHYSWASFVLRPCPLRVLDPLLHPTPPSSQSFPPPATITVSVFSHRHQLAPSTCIVHVMHPHIDRIPFKNKSAALSYNYLHTNTIYIYIHYTLIEL